MKSNAKHTLEELERYIHMYLSNGVSYTSLKRDHGLLLSHTVFGQKVLRYKKHGLLGIKHSKRKYYCDDLKEEVVLKNIKNGIPVKQLAREYNIPSHETVRRWVVKYSEKHNFQNKKSNVDIYTMQSRKTSIEEKIIIVNDFLVNGLSYKYTAEKYHVTYNNVYSWVRRYREKGSRGLIDGRGRKKSN